MPREFVIVTRRTFDTDDLRAAAAACGIDARIARAKKGALDLVLDAEDRVVLAVQYTQMIAVPDEVERLAPAAAAAMPGPVMWTEAWPGPHTGDLGERVAVELARRCDGVCVREDGSL